MDLFAYDPTENILPCDGDVNYFGCIISQENSENYLQALLSTIQWKKDEAIIYGKHIQTKRSVAWYGDSNFAYTYSNTTKYALPWTEILLKLKGTIENLTQTKYNSCLLNLYHNGDEAMSWHSDDEASLGKKHLYCIIELWRGKKVFIQTQNQ